MLRDLDLISNKIHCAVNQDTSEEPAVEKTRMEDSGSPSLIEHEESVETFSPPSAVIPGATGGSNGVVFNTKYEGPGTNVIAIGQRSKWRSDVCVFALDTFGLLFCSYS